MGTLEGDSNKIDDNIRVDADNKHIRRHLACEETTI